jgi:multiple sugar transport system permease protein
MSGRVSRTRARVGTPPRVLSGVVKVILTVTYLVPLIWVVVEAFKSDSENNTAPDALVFTPTLATIRTVIGSAAGSVLLSLVIASIATVAVIVAGVPAAYALTRLTSPWWGRVSAVTAIILLVLQMVPQPMTVIPLYGVLATWHLLGSIGGLAIADTALVLPFSILLLRPFALAIPRTLYEAAALDGAGNAQTLFRIVIPLLRNGIATVASIVFIGVWGEFIYATNFLSEGSTLPVSALLAEQISIYSTNWNRLMALALLTSLPLLVVFLFAQRRLTAGLNLGAVR